MVEDQLIEWGYYILVAISSHGEDHLDILKTRNCGLTLEVIAKPGNPQYSGSSKVHLAKMTVVANHIMGLCHFFRIY